MGLIDSVNKTNNLYMEVIEEEKNERLENKNKKIRQNNYKLELQQNFYRFFYQNGNAEASKAYFELIDNRLKTIQGISKNKEDEFAERELNLLYNKELNFIYNIFKKDEEAQANTIENQIFAGIQATYNKHGVNAFYKLQDVKYQFLDTYNLNCQKYDFYFDKINKHFFKYYKSIQEEEPAKTNVLYYILAILAGGFIRRSCWH